MDEFETCILTTLSTREMCTSTISTIGSIFRITYTRDLISPTCTSLRLYITGLSSWKHKMQSFLDTDIYCEIKRGSQYVTVKLWDQAFTDCQSFSYNKVAICIIFYINPLTAGAAYILIFIFLAHQVPPFKHVKDKMCHQSAIFENSWPPFCQIWIIFTHLKLWIASARHNFKWVKIQIE